MTPRFTVGDGCDPIGVSLMHVVVGGMGVGARNDHHSKFPTTGDECAERIAIVQPLTAVMQRNPCRIICYATAGAQTDSVGLRSLEIIEPKAGIESAWIILDQSELRPAHRFINPGGSGWRFNRCQLVQTEAAKGGRSPGEGAHLHKLSARERSHVDVVKQDGARGDIFQSNRLREGSALSLTISEGSFKVCKGKSGESKEQKLCCTSGSFQR